MKKRRLLLATLSVILIIMTLIVGVPQGTTVNAVSKHIGVNIGQLEISASPEIPSAYQSKDIKQTIISSTNWGYQYTLTSGDIVQVGDNRTIDFKAHVKTIRDDAWFSLGWNGGVFTPTVDNLTVSFNFNASTQVKIYPVEASARLPEGGIEYDIKLLSRPAQNTITLNIDWQGITWQKILALNVEYNETKCIDVFGTQGSPYVLTTTTIIGADGITYKTRPEYEVNSYLGTATSNRQTTEVIGINESNGQPITYTNLSTSKLFIHRGQMTDALGATAWVEDINMDAIAKTMTFTLPRTWLRNATYPVSQVCGVDPAYTQTWASFQSTALSGDATWSDVDTTYNSAVLSMVLSNATSGTENTLGVRANGSSLSRYISLHEAEGGGQTHCRMFVQTDANGIFEAYHSDISDGDYFYYSGYWTNVAFTEQWDWNGTLGSINWLDWTLGAGASRVHQIIIGVSVETAQTVGVRANGSSLIRSLTVHEAEAGGHSAIDMLVKADASKIVDLYAGATDAIYIDAGYFGAEMDFVEKWEDAGGGASASWQLVDLSAFLDQDGRMVDLLLINGTADATAVLGVRDGDDAVTARYLTEHEGEGTGGAGEATGFSMSAQSNSIGKIYKYKPTSTCGVTLTGYFKPALDAVALTNSPSSESLGTLEESTSYYAYGSAPSNLVTDGECTFTITNTGSGQIDTSIKATNPTGGVGWTLTDSAPGSNTVRVTAYYSGQNPASGVVLTTSNQAFYQNLAASGTIKWDFKFETGTFTDGALKTSTITITAAAG